ncbi:MULTISPECIES: hypothetical protein [Serratia]|uniref:hypothetical protein n=1 Tax=Serratia TaxID=613 RepID=UPI00149579C5|nr:hypothetical protein [Serratia marcescens]
MAKPINFEGAKLIAGGGLIKGNVYVRRHWMIIIADGTEYQREDYGRRDEPGLEMWQRWCVPGPNAWARPHWRPASRADRMQLQQWLRAHPDYLPDGGPCG